MEKNRINNAFYETLGPLWYEGSNHPAALLRAENRLRTPWIRDEIKRRYASPVSILDIGCGAGILANALAQDGHRVFGIDLSEASLNLAKENDLTASVDYRLADACALPFEDGLFDAVSAMDVLEHVETPERLIREAARVLKPGGIFFFHTFNRNFLTYLIVIKGVEWFVRNTPKQMHVYPLFIKPSELTRYCRINNLSIEKLHGFRPKFLSFPFIKMLLTRTVSDSFSFRFSKSLATGYCGIALKGAHSV